ncbi:hypothetical protein SAMN04515692_10141 [Leifsonia sp. CL147]|nr:hypothetical protein SAMN04515694_101437 [Leifsonia sp. CL154]SFL17202.1 hypothetical protein SAMN04515692_10141 [Leifsonia sp. CL147]
MKQGANTFSKWYSENTGLSVVRSKYKRNPKNGLKLITKKWVKTYRFAESELM